MSHLIYADYRARIAQREAHHRDLLATLSMLEEEHALASGLSAIEVAIRDLHAIRAEIVQVHREIMGLRGVLAFHMFDRRRSFIRDALRGKRTLAIG